MTRQSRFTVTLTKDGDWAVKKGSNTVATRPTKLRASSKSARSARNPLKANS
jgi:hypothetical protein